MGIIGDAARASEVLERLLLDPAKIEAFNKLRPPARFERAREPLVSVRAGGDAGHVEGCGRDHVAPGVCVDEDGGVR